MLPRDLERIASVADPPFFFFFFLPHFGMSEKMKGHLLWRG